MSKRDMPDKEITIKDFSPQLFWDTKQGSLDLDKNKRQVIERVIERGSREDLNHLMHAYSRPEIVEVIKEIPSLHPKDMAFVHVFFDIPYSEMKCYSRKQSAWN